MFVTDVLLITYIYGNETKCVNTITHQLVICMTSVLHAACGGGLVFAHPSALLPVTFTFEHSSLELLELTLSLHHIVGLECQTHNQKAVGSNTGKSS